jgi:hypothetical protein
MALPSTTDPAVADRFSRGELSQRDRTLERRAPFGV